MNWSTSFEYSAKEDKAHSIGVKLVTVLRYKNKEVMRLTGQMGRESLINLRNEYNEKNYEPKMGKVCIADLPPHERAGAIKRMSEGVQEFFTELVMNPEENANARRKYKQ